MIDNIRLVSLSYKTAPLEVRGRFALSETQQEQFLLSLRDQFALGEVLVLSTCNRTEIFYVSEIDLSSSILKALCSFNLIEASFSQSWFSFMEGIVAVAHLYRVTVGLESQILGDLQITNQVKRSYQRSADLELAGPALHKVLHGAFFLNKRVQNSTGLRTGAASTSYAATELVVNHISDATSQKVVVLGTGEIGSDVCRNLKEKSFQDVVVINRSIEKAIALAEECEFRTSPIENLSSELKDATILVASIDGKSRVITNSDVPSDSSLRLIVDLSVPKCIASDLDLTNCGVYDIDHLEEHKKTVLQERQKHVPVAESIVSEALEDIKKWSSELIFSDTIQKFKGALEDIRTTELSRYLHTFEQEDQKRVELMTQNILNKIIKLPVLQLKAACKRGEAEELSETLLSLFDQSKTRQNS